jgi:hypothetical protein
VIVPSVKLLSIIDTVLPPLIFPQRKKGSERQSC